MTKSRDAIYGSWCIALTAAGTLCDPGAFSRSGRCAVHGPRQGLGPLAVSRFPHAENSDPVVRAYFAPPLREFRIPQPWDDERPWWDRA